MSPSDLQVLFFGIALVALTIVIFMQNLIILTLKHKNVIHKLNIDGLGLTCMTVITYAMLGLQAAAPLVAFLTEVEKEHPGHPAPRTLIEVLEGFSSIIEVSEQGIKDYDVDKARLDSEEEYVAPKSD